MIAITVFDSLYSNARHVVERVVQTTGYQLVTDPQVISEAAKLSGMNKQRLAAAFPYGAGRKYDASSHGEAFGWLKLAMANMLSKRCDLLFYGYCANLVSPRLSRVLRVCLVSDMKGRMREGARSEGCPSPEIRNRIYADDLVRANWVMAHTESNDPWDRQLYDLVLPVSALGARQSACRVVEQLFSVAVQQADSSRESLKEFQLAAKAQTMISHWGNCVSVAAEGTSLTLSFIDNKQTLKEVARDLSQSVSGIQGVKSVEVGTGGSFAEVDVYDRPGCPISRNQLLNGEMARQEPLCGEEEDLALAARVKAALSGDGYPVSVYAKNGQITLKLTDHATMLRVVAQKLHDVVSRMDGVEGVEVGMVRKYHQPPAYRRVRQEAASRNLLRDDREFTSFRSDRLPTDRNLSISLYDGAKSADDDSDSKPEVVFLDADLPGFDLGEGVRWAKLNNPGTKVFVLSALKMGKAFEKHPGTDVSAYLSKPVSASVLGNAIRGAVADVRCNVT